MLSTRSSWLRGLSYFSSTANFATKALTLALATLVCCLCEMQMHAQSLSLGTLTTNGNPASCNSGAGFYYYVYPDTGLAADMTCQAATVSACSQVINGQTVTVSPAQVTIGYMNPVGVVSGVSVAKGLIVLHGGSGGTSPESFALTDAYFRAGYEVVQVVWVNDWELISDPLTGTGNIQAAACGPATLFKWVFTNLFPSVQNANKTAGMCALGERAGSAAVAYALAFYGAWNWFDYVSLLSGPPLSDIEQGCGVGTGLGNQDSITICSPTSLNKGWGCQLGGGSTWTLTANYVGGTQNTVQGWTNEPNQCAGTSNTTNPSNTDWLRESIVDQPSVSGGPARTFTYSNTAMSAWLCRSVVNNTTYNCALNGNANSNVCPNNSSPEG
jgi:hypothetical protein